MAVEPRRGCGWRKIGALYLVSDPGGRACDRLPLALTICPTCSHGIKQTRGFTWVNVAALFGGPHGVVPTCSKLVRRDEQSTCTRALGHAGACRSSAADVDARLRSGTGCFCLPDCPICAGIIERGGLLWIGEKFYPTPAAFNAEADALGVSRRITALPRDFKLGETWILLAHPKACDNPDRDVEAPPKIAGVFKAWRPQRVEKILADTDKDNVEELAKLEKAGITPVFVPANDKDHQGSAHDKENGKQPVLGFDETDDA